MIKVYPYSDNKTTYNELEQQIINKTPTKTIINYMYSLPKNKLSSIVNTSNIYTTNSSRNFTPEGHVSLTPFELASINGNENIIKYMLENVFVKRSSIRNSFYKNENIDKLLIKYTKPIVSKKTNKKNVNNNLETKLQKAKNKMIIRNYYKDYVKLCKKDNITFLEKLKATRPFKELIDESKLSKKDIIRICGNLKKIFE